MANRIKSIMPCKPDFKNNADILDIGEWNSVFFTVNRWLAAMVRGKAASKAEVDCVLDIVSEKLEEREAVTSADAAVNILRASLFFAFIAGKCFANIDDAANSAKKSGGGKAASYVRNCFAKCGKKGTKFNGIEFKILDFEQMYASLPLKPSDKKLFLARREALIRWKDNDEIVPEIP